MPIYEYECQRCKKRFEMLQEMNVVKNHVDKLGADYIEWNLSSHPLKHNKKGVWKNFTSIRSWSI